MRCCLICIILRFCAALIYIDILLLDEKIFQTIGDSHSLLTTTKRSIFFPLLLRQRSGGGGVSSGLGGVQLTEYKRTPAALFLFFKQISKDETKQKPTNQFLAAKM
jgi:hypothetical protein